MTNDQLNQLKAAYATGVLEVRESNTWVKYQSMADLKQAITDAEIALGINSFPSGVRKVRVTQGYR